MIIIGLLVAAVVFGIYAIATQYTNTVPTQTVPMRVVTSFGLAASLLGAALLHAIHTWTAP